MFSSTEKLVMMIKYKMKLIYSVLSFFQLYKNNYTLNSDNLSDVNGEWLCGIRAKIDPQRHATGCKLASTFRSQHSIEVIRVFKRNQQQKVFVIIMIRTRPCFHSLPYGYLSQPVHIKSYETSCQGHSQKCWKDLKVFPSRWRIIDNRNNQAE